MKIEMNPCEIEILLNAMLDHQNMTAKRILWCSKHHDSEGVEFYGKKSKDNWDMIDRLKAIKEIVMDRYQ